MRSEMHDDLRAVDIIAELQLLVRQRFDSVGIHIVGRGTDEGFIVVSHFVGAAAGNPVANAAGIAAVFGECPVEFF